MTASNRNKKYESKRKELGQEKITIWVPETTKIDFKLMAEFCCENKDTTPFMVRNLRTGRMAKGV